MNNKVSESVKDESIEALRKSFKSLGESITCNTMVTIRGEGKPLAFLRSVDITLVLNKERSYIEVECQEKDVEKYESFGLKKAYTVNDSKMIHEEHSDYQFTVANLTVYPVDTDHYIIIDLKK